MSPLNDRVLAKSPRRGQVVTLADHAERVMEAARLLFGTRGHPTRLGISWLRFFGLSRADLDDFVHHLAVTAILHDLGKANEPFQRAVRGTGVQVIPHEQLGALLLWSEPFRSWLSQMAGITPEIVLGAVLSHHLRASDASFPALLADVAEIRLMLTSPDVAATLQLATAVTGAVPPDPGALPTFWRTAQDTTDLKQAMFRFKRALRGNDRSRRLLLAVKAGLVAADSSGSALLREGLDSAQWIERCFGSPALTAEHVRASVLGPRVEELERRAGAPFKWHGFQDGVAELGPRALLLAGCGAGKTLAAWRWIAAQAERGGYTRAVFLYPTRATSTEGFRDYASWAGPGEAALMHGTSSYDLQDLFDDSTDSRKGADYTTDDRMFAIGYWPRRYFCATVDSFLAFMAHRYASIALLPVLAGSVLVIDEVHSFSESMFRQLERFLKFFDIPVLCMTATLTTDRLRTLTDSCGLTVFPQDPAAFADLEIQAAALRYRVQLGTADQAPQKVREALERGGRVLWVANTVARCQENTRRFAADCRQLGAPQLCYHSRFRLQDRHTRHEEVIAIFRGARGAALVCTTQVCQMSLDLDADCLVTEIAPAPDLIQRMGRCCRVPLPGSRRGDVFAYPPESSRPYDAADLAQGLHLSEAMASAGEVSQRDLAAWLESAEVLDPHAEDGYSPFLDSGLYACSRDEAFRDSPDFTVDCILDEDIPAYLELVRTRRPAAGLVVPAPRPLTSENPSLGRFLRQAPAECYDPHLGFVAPRRRDGRT